MYRMTKYIILIAFLCFESYLSAQIKHDVKKSQQIYNVKKSQTKYNVKESQQIYDVKDSVKIFFRQGKINLDPTLSDNQWALNRIADTLRSNYADSAYQLRKILVVGAASPEGSPGINRWLSEKRADVLFNHLSQYATLPDSLKSSRFIGPDWMGLLKLAKTDPLLPFREETLSLLSQIAGEAEAGIDTQSNRQGSQQGRIRSQPGRTRSLLERIRSLRGGIPYQYMYKKYFPSLRASQLFLWYNRVYKPLIPSTMPEWKIVKLSVDTTITSDSIHIEPIFIEPGQPRKLHYVALRTNMLYDALLMPNIGCEMYLGKSWSVAANWLYGWWKTDRRHWYWRAYGGDIAVRKWLGKAAEEKPLTGHHIGIYAQIFTYDFEMGGRGYMGGKPGGTIWNKMNHAVGAEYGYSLPIARKLNIDFSLGMGYWGGIYHEYKPRNHYYVWQATKERHWIGPTKLEVSLVWLLGHGNANRSWKGKKEKVKEKEVKEKKKEVKEKKKEKEVKEKEMRKKEDRKKGGADE